MSKTKYGVKFTFYIIYAVIQLANFDTVCLIKRVCNSEEEHYRDRGPCLVRSGFVSCKAAYILELGDTVGLHSEIRIAIIINESSV